MALDPKHRPQLVSRPASTVRREWWRYPQEAHLLDVAGHRYRRLRAREVAVLQGFPADWSDRSGLGELDLLRGYGNALPPPVAEAIAAVVAERAPGPLHTCVEICAGFGGFALGVSRALDIEHLALIDSWAPAARLLRSAGPWDPQRVLEADVLEFDWSRLGRVDLLAGGPPCQPWSQGGKGLGERDRRDLLGFTPELVGRVAPAAFIFENVPGLLSGDNERYASWLCERLRCPGEGLEYGVALAKLDAADFGVPQNRRRVFIVGLRGAFDAEVHACFDAVAHRRTHANPARALPPGRRPWRSLGEALDGWDRETEGWRRWLDEPAQDTATRDGERAADDRSTGAVEVAPGIGLRWPSRGLAPQWDEEAGAWTPHALRDEARPSGVGAGFIPARCARPLIPESGAPATDPWLVRGDTVQALEALERSHGGLVELVYLDAPRIETDAERFEAGDRRARLDTWLSLMEALCRRSLALLSPGGVVVVLAGTVEAPYVQVLLDELAGPQNHVGTVAWQKGYSAQNVQNLRELYATHDNLVIYARRRESCLRRVALEVPPSGFANPDGDPRGPWKAEQKGAAKPDCDYQVNLPPYRWRLCEGELPPGLWRVSPRSGVLWAPEVTAVPNASYRFVVEVEDREGRRARRALSIQVTAEASPPERAAPPWLIAEVDDLGVVRNAPAGGDELRVETGRLPPARPGAPYFACLEAAGGAPWIGQTRPGKRSSSGKGRYWDFPAATLARAAAEDGVDFKQADDAIPAIKRHLGQQTASWLNQVTCWTSAGRKPGDPWRVGYGQDAKKELEALHAAGVVDRVLTIAKPTALMCRLLALFSAPGGAVVDVGSPAAELSAMAAQTGRRTVYLELGGPPDLAALTSGVRLPRLLHASRGAHPLPSGPLFRDGLPGGARDGYFIGDSPRPRDDGAGVALMDLGLPVLSFDRELGVVELDYAAYPPGSRRMLHALASLEGLVPRPACDEPEPVPFAESLDGQVLCLHLPSRRFLDGEVIDEALAANQAFLAVPGRRLRIYYHRGAAGDGRVELRRVPFELRLAAGIT